MGSLSRGASTGRGRMEGYQSFARCANLLNTFPSPRGKTRSFWKNLFFIPHSLALVINKHVNDHLSLLPVGQPQLRASETTPSGKSHFFGWFCKKGVVDPPAFSSSWLHCAWSSNLSLTTQLLFLQCQRSLIVS
jgi:hypothetical protein